MSNVNMSQLHPTGPLSLLYDIFLSHSEYFAATTIYWNQYKKFCVNSNLLIIYVFKGVMPY
jgi:hypothetical protein